MSKFWWWKWWLSSLGLCENKDGDGVVRRQPRLMPLLISLGHGFEPNPEAENPEETERGL